MGLLDASPALESDRGAQFYVTDEHIAAGTSLAEASLPQLATLNPYVKVHVVPGAGAAVTAELVSKYSVVVLLDEFARPEQLRVAGLARAAGAKFICAASAGVTFGVFVDVGPAHVVSDPDGNPAFRGLLAHVSNASPAVVTVSDEHRHGLSDGMSVTFEEVEGMPELCALSRPATVRVLSPYSFAIDVDTTAFGAFSGVRGYFNQVKTPFTVSSLPLAESLAAPCFANDDFTGAAQETHALYAALSAFACAAANGANGSAAPAAARNALPAPDSVADAVAVASTALAALGKDLAAPAAEDAALRARLLALARCSGAQIAPVTSVAGGVVGQEVVKAASGKFLPIAQWFYYRDAEALPAAVPGTFAAAAATDSDAADAAKAAEADVCGPAVAAATSEAGFVVPANAAATGAAAPWAAFAPRGDRYDAYRAVFGATLTARAAAQRVFLVGAGAIGCEMLKNWALMGVGQAAAGGSITVTDMDSIEKSNLNRQFLFRATDVGQLKSAAAARAALAMNPALAITAQALRVGRESEATYNDDFWRALSGVYTALDNVEARLYVDGRCVQYQKPLVDSGTQGTKGNTQVVVPFQSESYGSTRDPPEEGIPLCTLKHFPHKIEHTIQWARDVFEGDFAQAPADVNSYLSTPRYVEALLKEPNTALPTLQRVVESLVTRRPLTFEDCLLWARWRFESEFEHNIAQLLATHPPDARTTEGAPFWSGTKRPPLPLVFDASDETHMGFVLAAANLRAFNYKLHGHDDPVRARAALASFVPTPFVPRDLKIATTDAEAKELAARAASAAAAGAAGLDFDSQVRALAAELPAPATLAGFRLNAVEFEKDDDTNHHVAFITACSNLRARNYNIKEASAHETKFVAGKIIPAIATTTALVTGLVCLEMFKLLQRKPLESYRSTFCNLADNVLVASEPFPMASQTAVFPSGEQWKWSLWDVVDVEVDGGRDITLGELVEWLRARFGVVVSMLNLGEAMVYVDFGVGLKKNIQERLPVPLSKLAEQFNKAPLAEDAKYLILDASVTDEDDNEIEIPPIRVRIRK